MKNSLSLHTGQSKLPGGDRWRELYEELVASQLYEIASKPSVCEPAGAELNPQRLLQLGEVAG